MRFTFINWCHILRLLIPETQVRQSNSSRAMSRQEMDVANHTVKINYTDCTKVKFSSSGIENEVFWYETFVCIIYLSINQSRIRFTFINWCHILQLLIPETLQIKDITVIEQWAVRKWTWQTIRWKDIYMQCISEVLLVVTWKWNFLIRISIQTSIICSRVFGLFFFRGIEIFWVFFCNTDSAWLHCVSMLRRGELH